MNEWERIGENQLDLLREIGNIGAGHAATAMSKLLNKPVNMEVPQVRLVPFDQIAEQVGGPEAVVAAIFLRIEGQVSGNMFLLMSVQAAKELVKSIFPLEPSSSGDLYFSDIEISALSEVGNILAGSYLSSLSDFMQASLSPTVPGFAVDMAGAILAYGLIPFDETDALLIETSFLDGMERIESHMFLLPDPDSFARIFTLLGVPAQ